MSHNRTKQLAVSALFCALVFVTTLIYVPAPLGNVNLGDGMLLLCAWSLGGIPAVASAALGAALCDLASGFAVYAPGTLVIKACMVIIAILVRKMLLSCRFPDAFCRILSALCAELTMIFGYLIYEATILAYGFATAAANIPFNAIQGAVAMLLALVAYPLLKKAKLFK